MATKQITDARPHGWAGTLTGKLLHYWGLTDGRGGGYQPAGSPLALCHNALVKDAGETFKSDPATDRPRCTSCTKYLAEAQKKQPQKPSAAPGKYVAEAKALVTRGPYSSRYVTLIKPHRDFPGFWFCSLPKQKRRKEELLDTDEAIAVLLSEGQLQLL